MGVARFYHLRCTPMRNRNGDLLAKTVDLNLIGFTVFGGKFHFIHRVPIAVVSVSLNGALINCRRAARGSNMAYRDGDYPLAIGTL